MWRLSGIFRNVTIWSAPVTHIRDFFIKTNLDDNYINATMDVTAKIKNYGSKPAKVSKLLVTVYDGDRVVASYSPVEGVPALKPGEEVPVRLSFPVESEKTWLLITPKEKNGKRYSKSTRTCLIPRHWCGWWKKPARLSSRAARLKNSANGWECCPRKAA